MTMLYVTGAYGRTYTTAERLKADWEAGKDFMIIGGPYTSIRDTQAILKDFDQIIGRGKGFIVDLTPKH